MAWSCESFVDGPAFHAAAGAFLLREEARYNLLLGLAERFGVPGEPGVAEAFALRDGADLVAVAALRSDERGLVVGGGAPTALGALGALADALADRGVALSAANGPEPAIDAFLARWCARTGAREGLHRRLRLHRLERVCAAARPAPGAMRLAREADRALAERCRRAFCVETHTPLPPPGKVPPLDEQRLFLWDDAGPAAMAAWSRPTPRGCSIGLVYTPPENRARGYATALVTALSQRMLDGGKAFCTLFTDVANPISNRIYARIGYVPLADYRDVRLVASRDS